MNKIIDLYRKIMATYKRLESILSNVKFAVVIISLFTVALIYGTFMESYHGTDYANRLVYKSWWFMLIQLFMFLSIFTATVVRLPVKKRLYGFYVIHSGLIVLFLGSFFTYINGVDGSLQLIPNSPSSTVYINEDILRLNFIGQNKFFEVKLPYTASQTTIDSEINGVKLKRFYPFAENEIQWTSDSKHDKRQHSSQYLLFNENISQEITLSLSTKSDFKSMQKLGLLTVHYMPKFLAKCFGRNSESGFIIWNLLTNECFTPEEKKYPMGKTDKGARFITFKYGSTQLKFFPDFTPVAVNDDLSKNTNTPFRVVSRDLFVDQANLFLFGEEISYYKKISKKWVVKSVASGAIQKLPWMNFKLQLLKSSNITYPVQIPQAIKPIQDGGEVIRGKIRAVEVAVDGQNFWVRTDGPLSLSNSQKNIKMQIVPREIKLPYQLALERFQMNKNPGTNDPASFESYVQLLDGRGATGVEKHHVYMNNPLKYDEFTFYQSSYFPVGPDQFASVLSVNYDPGRFFKYLGSLLIVLGSIWHFIINRKKKKVLA